MVNTCNPGKPKVANIAYASSDLSLWSILFKCWWPLLILLKVVMRSLIVNIIILKDNEQVNSPNPGKPKVANIAYESFDMSLWSILFKCWWPLLIMLRVVRGSLILNNTMVKR